MYKSEKELRIASEKLLYRIKKKVVTRLNYKSYFLIPEVYSPDYSEETSQLYYKNEAPLFLCDDHLLAQNKLRRPLPESSHPCMCSSFDPPRWRPRWGS